MEGYLDEKLRDENLFGIIQKCKIALHKGYLSDSVWEKNQIEKVRKYKNFTQFCYKRKKAQIEYDRFCRFLEKILPEIEKIENPVTKLSNLKELFEKALILDGKRRVFDYTFNLSGNILEYYMAKLRKFLQEKFLKTHGQEQIDIWFSNLINITPHHSYSYLELRDLLGLSTLCSISIFKNSKEISKYFIHKSRKDSLFAKKFKKCLRKYARRNVKSLSEKLLFYAPYKNQEKDILEKLSSLKKQTKKKKEKTIEEIKRMLPPNEKKLFNELVIKIAKLLFMNENEDPFRNNNMDGLADYFLRKNIATTLYILNQIRTPEPMDYPQHYLLKKVKKVLKEKNEHLSKNYQKREK